MKCLNALRWNTEAAQDGSSIFTAIYREIIDDNARIDFLVHKCNDKELSIAVRLLLATFDDKE